MDCVKPCEIVKNSPEQCKCGPPMIPSIAPGLPTVQVNPCPPNEKCCAPCCNVCVPVIQPDLSPPAPPAARKKCKYVQPARVQSYKPERFYEPPQMKMADDTIYRKSYLPVDYEKPIPVRPELNICLGEGPFAKDTINKMSYKGHKDVLPPCPILPCQRKLMGDGPMQDITTSKHDYVPKPISKTNKIIPPENLFTSDCPLSDKTVNRLSYQPVDASKVKAEPIRPVQAIEKATGKFAENTVHRMSYQPWEPQEPVDTPWARKPKFSPPILRMADDTVHKLSYSPPGHYVECADNEPNCVPCPDPPCQTNATPKCQPCGLPCCCPKAAC